MASRHQPDRDRDAGEVLGPPDARVRTHVDRVPRNAVRIGDELPHAGARVAHAAPRARISDGLGAFQKRLVLRARLVASGPPLHLAEVDVPHHLRIEVLLAGSSLPRTRSIREAAYRWENADLGRPVHQLGDGNTADQGLVNTGDIIAHNVRPAARQRADARRRLRPGRDRLHAHLRRAEPAPPGSR